MVAVCGIAGWAGTRGPEATVLGEMVMSLWHRGPDEVGFWESAEVSLGMSRLAIIDVPEGQQPVFSEDRAVVAVCNGEIYNYRELAAEVRSHGITLASGSDVEVIPHLYKIHGEDFISRLRGMFALALYDLGTKTLMLARDRVGKKPLHFAVVAGTLIFGSEVRALLAGGVPAKPNLQSLDHVLAFGHVPLAEGAFEGVQQVRPGHVLTFSQGTLTSRAYWRWIPDPQPLSLSEAKHDALRVIDEAVRMRLVAERPIGAFLSGGIDSTVVTALMTRHHSGPVKTFTVGFADAIHDESKHAREVAQFLGTDHKELMVEPDPVIIMDRLASVYDEPFADSSAVPTLLLNEFAAKEVVVALAGDGGDEAFGGYVRYRAAASLQKFNGLLSLAGIAKKPLMVASKAFHKPRLARLAEALKPQASLGDRYLRIMSMNNAVERSALWTREVQESVNVGRSDEEFLDVWQRSEGQPPINRMRTHDVESYLPEDLLVKVDIASMANSVEVRSPLLDQEVLAFGSSLPRDLMLRAGTEKWLLRQVAYDLVPRHLIDRPKQGFSIPRAAWLRGPLREMVHDLLLDDTARQRGWFSQERIRALLLDHDEGVDRDMQLWPLIVIEAWARSWVD